YCLGAYVYSTDREQALRVADRLQAGMVFVNVVGADSAELSFGGVKRSGFGRELGRLGIGEFVNKKLIRIGPFAADTSGSLSSDSASSDSASSDSGAEARACPAPHPVARRGRRSDGYCAPSCPDPGRGNCWTGRPPPSPPGSGCRCRCSSGRRAAEWWSTPTTTC